MSEDTARADDPVYISSRREAFIILVAWLICGIYTCSYCFLTGYSGGSGETPTLWGIPSWVVWGILCPWLLVNVFAFWFCFFFIRDEDLGEDPPSERPEASEEGA